MRTHLLSHFIRFVALLMFLNLAGAVSAGEVREPKPGSAERKAIMEAMRGPVSKRIGKRVIFTGSVKVSGECATFQGNVAPADGVAPKGDAGGDLELDFFALLRREKDTWTMLLGEFAGDIGPLEEARKKFPGAPKELLPDFSAR